MATIKDFPWIVTKVSYLCSGDDASAHHGKGTRQLRSHRCFLHVASTALGLPETKQAFQTEVELPAARTACAEDGSGNMGCAKSDSLWPA
jgi:hypothetical protein